jgi:excisionase family DNA binding protein
MLDQEQPLEVTMPLAHRIPRAAEEVDVSISTMRRWIRQGRLPTYEINGVVLIAEDDLVAFIRDHRRS